MAFVELVALTSAFELVATLMCYSFCSDEAERELKKAKSKLEKAESELDEAKSKLKKLTERRERGEPVDKDDLARADKAVENARADVENARADVVLADKAVERADNNLSYRFIGDVLIVVPKT